MIGKDLLGITQKAYIKKEKNDRVDYFKILKFYTKNSTKRVKKQIVDLEKLFVTFI